MFTLCSDLYQKKNQKHVHTFVQMIATQAKITIDILLGQRDTDGPIIQGFHCLL